MTHFSSLGPTVTFAFKLLGLMNAVWTWSKIKAPAPNPDTMIPVIRPLRDGNH